MDEKITIYPAAALFNGRETYFNSRLVEKLEDLGFETLFPQRDGFEFSNLADALSTRLAKENVDTAVQDIIYLLDMGKFIPDSDVVLVNLDEPLDDGALVETTYANLMGKNIIGLRGDVRSPYGMPSDRFNGMHFFPGFQTHQFISYNMSAQTSQERERELDSLIGRIDKAIYDSCIRPQQSLPKYVTENPQIAPVLSLADKLFSDIQDIHSEEGLEAIAKRYVAHQSEIRALGPELIGTHQ